VVDLTAQGFTLIGGRLDYIVPAPLAPSSTPARVINLFVAQTASTEHQAADRRVG
jgi:anti-sigma factor RsiW